MALAWVCFATRLLRRLGVARQCQCLTLLFLSPSMLSFRETRTHGDGQWPWAVQGHVPASVLLRNILRWGAVDERAGIWYQCWKSSLLPLLLYCCMRANILWELDRALRRGGTGLVDRGSCCGMNAQPVWAVELLCSGGRQSRLLDRGQLTAPTNGVNSRDHVVFITLKHFSEPLSLNNR